MQVPQNVRHFGPHLRIPEIVPLHRPDGRRECRGQALALPFEAPTNSWIRVVLVPFPTGQTGPHEPGDTGPVDLKIAAERPQQQFRFLAVRDVRVPVVENELPVDVAHLVLAFVLHPSLGRQFSVKWRTRNRSVEHELVEVGGVTHGAVDDSVDIRWSLIFQPDDRRT